MNLPVDARESVDSLVASLTSAGGGRRLREGESPSGLFARLEKGFVDPRHPNSMERQLRTVLAQQVCGLALGDEDRNDHDEWRDDALLALRAGHPEFTGARGECRKGHGKKRGDGDHKLAGSGPLPRLELGVPKERLPTATSALRGLPGR